jgi:predicted phage tail protein
MTQVTLHGILGQEFQKCFNLAIKRPKEVFDAISCAYPQFRNRLAELARQGIHFAVLIDGKRIEKAEDLNISTDQDLDIVPIICGAGSNGGIIAIIAIGLLTGGAGLAMGAGMFATTGIFSAASALGTALTSIGASIALMGLQMALAPKPKMERPSSDVSGAKQSFNFSSKANVAEQGIPVPVGYGRLRVGSVVIQSSVKSYPQAFAEQDIFSETTETSQARTNIRL